MRTHPFIERQLNDKKQTWEERQMHIQMRIRSARIAYPATAGPHLHEF